MDYDSALQRAKLIIEARCVRRPRSTLRRSFSRL